MAFVGRGIILLVNMTNVDVFGSYQSSMLVFSMLVFVFVVQSGSILDLTKRPLTKALFRF